MCELKSDGTGYKLTPDSEWLGLCISNAFNDAGAYTGLMKLLSPDILTQAEVEELIDRLESFTEQEIQEIIDER